MSRPVRHRVIQTGKPTRETNNNTNGLTRDKANLERTLSI